jgi:hypothetical protein
MDLKAAIMNYQFADRAKSELIVCSQLVNALGSFPQNERAGGRRMLIMIMEAVRAELQMTLRSTEQSGFRRSTDLLSEAISLVESEQYGPATLRISEAVTGSTTVAQASWQVLNEHGLL